jgi:uncharacterized membrane-anchored protein YjiN (DUF445 family)
VGTALAAFHSIGDAKKVFTRVAQSLDIIPWMKRLPLLLLALMAALFFVTLNHPQEWAGWLHAFSEAGMVGVFA